MNTNPWMGTRGVRNERIVLEIKHPKRLWREEKHSTRLVEEQGSPVYSESRHVPLNAWQAESACGNPIHISYRSGELVVEVDVKGQHGRKPVVVLRWCPHEALILAKLSQGEGAKKMPVRDRLEAAWLAKQTINRAETRSINGKSYTIPESLLRQWLSERERHFGFLNAQGLAGGPACVRMTD